MSVTLFDAKYYSIANPDLALAGLTTSEQLFDHFQKFGLDEGRKFSAFVDLNFYKQNNLDLGAAGLTTNRQVYEHLQNLGVTEGRQFSAWLDLEFYLVKNPDVQQFYGNDRAGAFEHLQNLGINEKRQFSPLLNLNYYLAANPDVGQAFAGDALKILDHLETKGIFEKRLFSFNFDPNYYRNIYPDLAAPNLNDLELLQHFASYGLREGRRSSEKFDINYYWENNPDLKAAGLNYQQAFQHAYLHGWQEGRPSSPGHTVGEPVVIWKRTPNNYSSTGHNIFDLSQDSAGNIRTIAFNYLSSRPYTLLGATFSFYEPSNGQFLGSKDIDNLPARLSKIVFDKADNIYLTGNNLIGYFGGSNNGSTDKYDSNGNVLWSKVLNENSFDYLKNYTLSNDIAVDSAGNAYVVGATNHNVGAPTAGRGDALIVKYNTNGDRLWIKQIDASENDNAFRVTTDNTGNIYVLGNFGAQNWLSKYDSLTGDRIWIKQIDLTITPGPFSALLINNASNIYVASNVPEPNGDTQYTDISLAKYDSLTGNQQWLQKFGTKNDDFLRDLDIDNAGNVYVGSNNRNYKFDSNGILQSILPASKSDLYDITLDNSGNIYTINFGSLSKYSPIAEFL